MSSLPASIIRPVTRQGSLPEMRFSFLKHFRILYSIIPNTIHINQRLCNNWNCKDLTQNNSKSVTLILRSCTGIWMVLHKILDKTLSSCHNWLNPLKALQKKWNCKTFITKLLYKNSESVWPSGLGWEWYHIKFWTSFYHHAKHESIHQRLHKNRHCKNLNTNFNTKILSPWPWP